MARSSSKSYTIVSGSMFVWVSDFELLNLAQQNDVVLQAKSALQSGLTVVSKPTPAPLFGVALGKGSRDSITPVKMKLDTHGYPLFSCPVVCTTGRVPGLPGQLGYVGEPYRSRSRKWIFSFNKPISEWRRELRLPEVWDVRPATFRTTSSRGSDAMRTQIYREIRDGRKF